MYKESSYHHVKFSSATNYQEHLGSSILPGHTSAQSEKTKQKNNPQFNIPLITAENGLGHGCSTTYIGLKETKLKNQFSTYTS
jgi:hypothetical protein